MIRKVIVLGVALLLPVIAYAAEPQICPGKIELAGLGAGMQPGLSLTSTCGTVCAPQMYQSGLMSGSSGVSCAAATSVLTAQLQSYAKGVCLENTGYFDCSLQIIPVGACQFEGGLYSQIGYANFHCRYNNC
ncbi:MAG TPA: hypothetical protein VMW75_19375 [Thermoanaerobaculia bacterium]|nr:hypothetical protein [Thermoanaerobaculia bacterium]